MVHLITPRKALLQTGLLLGCLGAYSPVHADLAAVETILQDPNRELTDKIRDPVRKPAAVLEFLGIKAGDKIFEVYAGGGYYTVILAAAVGETGVVYAQNSPRVLRYEEDRSEVTAGEALDSKINLLKLHNVQRIDQRMGDIQLPPNSLDVVVLFQILHDYYNGGPARAEALLLQLKKALKPGGTIGVIDHVGIGGVDNRRFHRMQKADAIALIESAGFIVEAESDLLANPKDDHRRSIFDPRYNRNTDRFLLRVRVPAE